jgi:hypothetical protein
MPKSRTILITTPSGPQASLNLTSSHACLDSLISAVDQYQQRYGELPTSASLADGLLQQYKWLLRKWLESKQIVWFAHYGEPAWLLLPEPERKGSIYV